MPTHALEGNKTPAEINGDAHPTMHRAGIAESMTAAVAANGLRAGRRVQKTTHGNVSTALAVNNRETDSTTFDGQYTSDMAITGKEAMP
jgi:hypothetical protein